MYNNNNNNVDTYFTSINLTKTVYVRIDWNEYFLTQNACYTGKEKQNLFLFFTKSRKSDYVPINYIGILPPAIYKN